ncbi:MAG: hypothetical protein JXB08_02055 [Bacilli bacterium]|nr:hypothetical protein [Bacilli bacterium]MBN2876224.1 hypothetical protein [Bacilli bacterium]
MEKGAAKKYFKKINTTFEGVNKQDDFAKAFLDIIGGADTTLYHKERRERRVFDDSFMDAVEAILPVIEKLTRNPDEMLKKFSEIVPVERAKKIDADTVRHLAANTQLIRSADQQGNVTPSKVLTSYSEADLGTYENRFLMTLINKIYTFITFRYDVIVEKSKTEYINYLKINSKIDMEDSIVDYDITFQIHQKSATDEIGQRNAAILKRITTIRDLITRYKLSRFMRAMESYQPIKPPIMKTNKILKNYDYKACYEMWNILDEIDRVGYDVDVFERDVEFEEKYVGEIENAMMVLYATVANNQLDDFEMSHEIPINYSKRKTPKVMLSYERDTYMQPGEYIFQDNTLNQYFLDQIRRGNENRFKTLLDAGIDEEEAIKIIYQRLSSIADSAFVDFINEKYRPEDEKTVRDRIKMQNKVLKSYQNIERLQKDNAVNMQTQKALAQLILNNYQDDLKRIMEEEKLQKEIEAAEEMKRMMDQKKAEVDEQIEKKLKIKKAKDILDNAEKERREKKIQELKEFN